MHREASPVHVCIACIHFRIPMHSMVSPVSKGKALHRVKHGCNLELIRDFLTAVCVNYPIIPQSMMLCSINRVWYFRLFKMRFCFYLFQGIQYIII